MNNPYFKQFSLETPHEGFINITQTVQRTVVEAVKKIGSRSGTVVVFCPHTTAAITINENADPDVQHDLLIGLDKAFPQRSEYLHIEGNSSSHLKSSCFGCSKTILVQEGSMVLGTWQAVYFCEFDGPKKRIFYVQVNL